jgi:folate-binding protein YgfZ
MTDLVYTKLPNRAIITLKGDDRFSFIQNLITQDMRLLETMPLIYACLLTPQGKFLFDMFIRNEDGAYQIDCEGGDRAKDLFQRLSMFKLRSKVELDLQDDVNVWQVWNGIFDHGLKYPRHDTCGYRVYSDPSSVGMTKESIHTWDAHRIRHEIPDGSRDMIPEKSFLHESAIIAQTAVSYKKGCYLGQELVSRMHHRGLIKKQLKCVDVNAVPEGAELRSICGDIGLALVKL